MESRPSWLAAQGNMYCMHVGRGVVTSRLAAMERAPKGVVFLLAQGVTESYGVVISRLSGYKGVVTSKLSA